MISIIITALIVGATMIGFEFGYQLAKKRYYIDETFNHEETIDKILEIRKKHKKHIEEIDNELAKIKYMEK